MNTYTAHRKFWESDFHLLWEPLNICQPKLFRRPCMIGEWGWQTSTGLTAQALCLLRHMVYLGMPGTTRTRSQNQTFKCWTYVSPFYKWDVDAITWLSLKSNICLYNRFCTMDTLKKFICVHFISYVFKRSLFVYMSMSIIFRIVVYGYNL